MVCRKGRNFMMSIVDITIIPSIFWESNIFLNKRILQWKGTSYVQIKLMIPSIWCFFCNIKGKINFSGYHNNYYFLKYQPLLNRSWSHEFYLKRPR